MQHPELTEEKWFSLSTAEQLANVGSEVVRALNWREKGRLEYADRANLQALELFDLTLRDRKLGPGIKEVARARELWLDYFLGGNQYHQTGKQWKKYFEAFTYLARQRHS